VDIVRVLTQQKGIDTKKRNNAKKKPKELAKSKEILQILKASKHKLKKEMQPVPSSHNNDSTVRRKPKEYKRAPSFRTISKSKNRDRGTQMLIDLVKSTMYKKGTIEIFSNNKWKGRWIR
jgi:hypothetical protein